MKLAHSNKPTLAVITGSRAEYGLLRPVLQKAAVSTAVSLSLLVTGSHLSESYGHTVDEILADGFQPDHCFPILTHQEEPLPLVATFTDALQQFSAWFSEHRPDCVLVLGDRYEIYAACLGAALVGVPIAHISGGDVTLGAADEYYRHCITKMAVLHFPSCDDSAKRLLRMGEPPERVFCVGGLGDENIRNMPLWTVEQLSDSISFSLKEPFALVTFHPETSVDAPDPMVQMDTLLKAMERFHEQTGIRYLITKSNADQGGDRINQRWDQWTGNHSDYAIAVTSLGVTRYLSAMKAAKLVLGNSSSGVIETPSFQKPTVNIGDRQKGRLICDNVLCCPCEEQAILSSMEKAFSEAFVQKCLASHSPYYGSNPSGDILSIVEQSIASGLLQQPKSFYDGV